MTDESDFQEELDAIETAVDPKDAAAYFEHLKNNSYDRPSAWWAYSARLGLEERFQAMELSMYGKAEEPENLVLLNEHFQGKIPAVLMTNSWDT